MRLSTPARDELYTSFSALSISSGKCLDAMFRFGCLRSDCGKQASEHTLSTAASASHHEPLSRRRERFNRMSTSSCIPETSPLPSARAYSLSRSHEPSYTFRENDSNMQESFVLGLKFNPSTKPGWVLGRNLYHRKRRNTVATYILTR